jgi:hypothetical protein
MPTCSTSSNISSAINSLNITQGSGGSRLIVSIPAVSGMTYGSVVRYDIATSGFTLSKADLPQNAEVFGVVESYTSSTNKLNIVMNGSITIPDAYLTNLPLDISGAAGGNDIYFLSGITAGLLQNLAPTNLDHIVKPIYQKAPHGSYSGSVVNYSGYKMGGDVQASLDSASMTGRVGNLQLTFDQIDFAEDIITQQRVLQNSMIKDPTTGMTPLLSLNPNIAKEWNLEYIRVDQFGNHCYLRPIDFPEFLGYTTSYGRDPVGLAFQYGWIERLRIDDNQSFSGNSSLGSVVRQYNHSILNDNLSQPNNICYGTVFAWDEATRHVYILRYPAQTLSRISPLPPELFETSTTLSSGGFISIRNNSTGLDEQFFVTSTVKDTQLAAVKTQVVDWNLELITNPGINTGFFTLLNVEGITDPVNTAWDGSVYTPYGRNPVPYLKIKNKGISVSLPQTLSVDTVTTENVNLPNYDIIQKIIDIEARLAAGNL